MLNLSECKFGDKLRTKGGQMALFLGNKRQLTNNVCAIEDESLGYLSLHYNDNGTPSYPVRSKYCWQMGGRAMKGHKYTNKDERPVPRYMVGDVAWKKCGWHDYDVEYTVIRAVCDIRWIDYSDNPCWDDVPHWEITYRHKPKWNERMVQNPIEEEALYDTEAEAIRAIFDEFADDTRRILGQFGARFRQLGISQEPTLRMLDSKDGIPQETEETET